MFKTKSVKNILAILILLSVSVMTGQEKFTLSGTISEAQSGETMIGVNILVTEDIGVSTDLEGKFVVSGLLSDCYDLNFQYLH